MVAPIRIEMYASRMYELLINLMRYKMERGGKIDLSS